MGHKILLADDSITIQKVIELTFSDEDFELHTVGNGQKAIDEIRSIMPHIVLCDIIMPEKNGYEVCEFIKTSADLRHIPVLLLTGAFEPFDQERARSVGCDGFLAKPFEPQTLISKVKELLSRAPAAVPAPKPVAPPPVEVMDERTVIMPPSGPAAMPPPIARGPQLMASPPPPPPPPAPPKVDYGGGLDDAFAIEAGERELRMEPGDHTVLLGGRDTRSASAPSGGDDIWGEVSSPAAAEEEDSSTIFMAPPPVSPPPAAPAYQSPEYEVQYEADDLDSTWRMPNAEPSAPPEPAYSGFEDYPPPRPPAPSAYTPPVPEPPPPFSSMPPLAAPPPHATPEPELEPLPTPFEPYDPFVASATASKDFSTVSPFDRDATLDGAPGGAGGVEPLEPLENDNFDRIPSSPFENYGEPEIVAESEVEPIVEPPPSVYDPFTAASRDRFDEIDASPPTVSELEADSIYPSTPNPPAAPASAPSSPSSIDDALIDKVAQRVVDKLSAKIIQEIAWEVVPDLAEGMIQKEIEALKAKLAKVPK